MEHASWTALAAFAADFVIRVGLSVRVIMRRRPVGVSLAWLTIILIFPFAGAAIYLLFGELRLGKRRAEYAARIHKPYQAWLADLRSRTQVDWTAVGAECEPLASLAEAAGGIPALPGNELRLLDDAEAVFRALIADIDAARRTCHLEFYIWKAGGMPDDVAEALLRASTRGVICRVLVDAVGSRAFLRGHLVERLRQGGIRVQAALPVSLFRMLFVRSDLRLHRKIVVIDGEVAYTGSMNLVDPRFFKQHAHVGPWVDSMARMRGPAVEALAITFLEDWELETGEGIEQLRETSDAHPSPPSGPAIVQVVPSGPIGREESIQGVLLMAIYAARRALTITTPYFVPDESLVMALMSAAFRGVAVTLIVPARVDSILARLASQPHLGDLLEAGVRIALFEDGLLHTKSVTVDGELSVFGSLNLDPRSLVLNFEITLLVYDRAFTTTLRALQESYIERSRPMDLASWRARPPLRRFAENAARLLSPLL
jgi:cardiolipin synthase A/B